MKAVHSICHSPLTMSDVRAEASPDVVDQHVQMCQVCCSRPFSEEYGSMVYSGKAKPVIVGNHSWSAHGDFSCAAFKAVSSRLKGHTPYSRDAT